MSHSIEVSDDEDSFSLSQHQGPVKSPYNDETILLSSDNEPDDKSAINFTSDEEDDLPKVSVRNHKKNVIKSLFPNSSKSTKQLKVDNVDKVEAMSSKPHTQKPRDPGFDKIIGGVTVNLPVDPYGCQIALMSKVSTIYFELFLFRP